MFVDREVTFAANTTLPHTQCKNFMTQNDNILEGTHDLAVMINDTALPPSLSAETPVSLTVIITDDEGECKILYSECLSARHLILQCCRSTFVCINVHHAFLCMCL